MSIFSIFSSSSASTSSSAANKRKAKKAKSKEDKEAKNKKHQDEDEEECQAIPEEETATDDDDNINDSDEEYDEVSGEEDDDDDEDESSCDDEERCRKDKSGDDNPLLPEEMCELPTFLNTPNCDKKLVDKARELLKLRASKRPNNFVVKDYERMLVDDWTVSRFLLRCRNNPSRAAKLMEACGKFRREFRMADSQLSDFPIEFHKAGGLFKYMPDRVGNETLYMRVKMHMRSAELSKIMKEFILCAIEDCDRANDGRGTAIIFDLTGCGMQSVDPSFLYWLVSSFRNYCPKGLSYIIVYNLPWMLSATAKLALSWLSSTNKKRLRFISGPEIEKFIAPENLPDFMGGTCKLNYRRVAPGSRSAVEVAEEYNLTKQQSLKLRESYVKFLKNVDPQVNLDSTDSDFDEYICDSDTKKNKQIDGSKKSHDLTDTTTDSLIAGTKTKN